MLQIYVIFHHSECDFPTKKKPQQSKSTANSNFNLGNEPDLLEDREEHFPSALQISS